jgi:chromosome transmission fidelity protein 8
MPAITLHPPAAERASQRQNALPQLLQTPSGFAILEIQGTVNSTLMPPEGQQDKSDEAALPVGQLMFPLHDPAKGADDTAWQKRVYLYVGKHQRLTGEVKRLAKPIAVVRRKPAATGESGESGESDDMEVAEIIHYKLLFAHRPEPVGQSGDEVQ